MEALRFTQQLEQDDKVDVGQFYQMVTSARTYAEQNSNALKKFRLAIQNHGKNAISQFELTDVNKDGAVNIDGFKVVLLTPEFNMNSAEVEEAYYILQGVNEGFNYRDWIA